MQSQGVIVMTINEPSPMTIRIELRTSEHPRTPPAPGAERGDRVFPARQTRHGELQGKIGHGYLG